jgi:hypothetical protein
VLRSVGAYILSVVLVLLSSDAFRQALAEFRDTEPGSLLFGALQLMIGTSAAVAAIGVFKRTSWAARSIGIGGIAAVVLLVSQPVFEPMTTDAQRSIWFGAAVVGVAATGIGWFARRLARDAAVSRASAAEADVPQPSPVLLPDAQRPAESIIPAATHSHVPRGASTQRHDSPPED